MAPACLDHALFEGCWPSCHAIIKIRLRLRPRQCARAVTIAHRFVFDHVIFIRGDHLALLPDRDAHRSVGTDRVARPISAGIRKIKAPWKSACHDLATEFCRQQFSVPLNPLEVSRATVKQEEAGFFAVGADGNSFRIVWFVHHHSDIPLYAENVDSEYVFGLAHGDIRYAQDFLGIFDALLPRNELRRLPALVSFSFHFDLPFVGYKERKERKEILYQIFALSAVECRVVIFLQLSSYKMLLPPNRLFHWSMTSVL